MSEDRVSTVNTMHVHICTAPDCNQEVHPKRWALGYRTCIDHGAKPTVFTVAPAYNKGGYQLITASDVKHIGKAK